MEEIVRKLSNQRVKICKSSITIKDENDKTRGVVRNIKRYVDAPARERFGYFKDVKASGIWGTEYSENLVMIDKKLYYLNNMRHINFYKNMVEKFNDESDRICLEKIEKLAEEAAKYMPVIDCYVI